MSANQLNWACGPHTILYTHGRVKVHMPSAPPFFTQRRPDRTQTVTANIFPGLRKCLRICPGLIKLKGGKEASGGSPLNPTLPRAISALAEMSGDRPKTVRFYESVAGRSGLLLRKASPKLSSKPTFIQVGAAAPGFCLVLNLYHMPPFLSSDTGVLQKREK